MDQGGLKYCPSRFDPPVGHAGFEIRLGGRPRPYYFDTCRASFPVENSGILQRMTLAHPSRLTNTPGFIVGRIRLDTFDGDCEEIFTFGGRATIAVEGNETVCRVTSSAPFLPLDLDPQSPFVLLGSELEIVIAQCRAEWKNKERHYLSRLGALDPMALFVSSIKTLEYRFDRLSRIWSVGADQGIRRAWRLVCEIRGLLELVGEWPAATPGLAELLKTPPLE